MSRNAQILDDLRYFAEHAQEGAAQDAFRESLRAFASSLIGACL